MCWTLLYGIATRFQTGFVSAERKSAVLCDRVRTASLAQVVPVCRLRTAQQCLPVVTSTVVSNETTYQVTLGYGQKERLGSRGVDVVFACNVEKRFRFYRYSMISFFRVCNSNERINATSLPLVVLRALAEQESEELIIAVWGLEYLEESGRIQGAVASPRDDQ